MAYIPGWPFLSLYSSSPSSAFCQPQRFRALSPDPGGLAPASAGPSEGPHRAESQRCPLTATVIGDGALDGRVWQAPWEPGCCPRGGGHRGQCCLPSLARAQYRSAGPHPVHLPCGSWGQWLWQVLPQTQPSWAGERSFTGLSPYLVLRLSIQCL